MGSGARVNRNPLNADPIDRGLPVGITHYFSICPAAVFGSNLARRDTVNNGRRRCLYGHSGSMNLGAQSLKIFNIELAGTDH